MANTTMGLSPDLAAYVRRVGAREPQVLARLREETAALPQHGMQIAPEEGSFLAMLVELTGARRYLEIGTFTGYSSTVVALALPQDGHVVCCDVSQDWTSMARRYWEEAGVAAKVDLRVAPAAETLEQLLADGEGDTYDLAFIDADKAGYDTYYEFLLRLVRPGGLIVFDNTLWSGKVIDPDVTDADTLALKALNDKLASDERISVCLLPIADGVTLARRR
jgi:predicted O-methyltransferase YrrM